MKAMPHFCKILFIILFLSAAADCRGTTAHIYGEGGYSETHCEISIFADINTDSQGPLISAGVRILYPTAKLTNPIAIKNEQDWYFGPPTNTFPYLDPITTTEGQIIFYLGKLDPLAPLAGIDGKRILLGTVSLERIPTTEIPTANDFSLAGGLDAPFINFMTTAGDALDSAVQFTTPTIHTTEMLLLEKLVRILHVLNNSPAQDTPARVAELDRNGDNHINMPDALLILKELSL